MFGTPRIGGVPLLGAKGTAKLLRAATGSLDEGTWPFSIDTSLKQCRRPEQRPPVFFERRLSVEESGSVEDDLRLVLILPDGLRQGSSS